MILDNQALEAASALCNRSMIGRRDRLGIKETATVIKLQLPRWGKVGKREINLRWDGSGGDCADERYCATGRT